MFTLAMLSWGAHKTLINTLGSYAMFGLDHLASQKIIYFQEFGEREQEIADHFGYDAIGSPENIGIALGYRKLIEAATQPFFLFLENDWMLLERPDEQIASGLFFLDYGVADVVRYRHRKFPGNPLWTRQFEGREYERPTHLLDSVHWCDDPSVFPEIEKVRLVSSGDWYLTSSQHANWTNNPTMFDINFLRARILPRLGGGDVERDIQSWWEKEYFQVIQGNGLFNHYRIG